MRKTTYLDTQLIHVHQNEKITVAKCRCKINLDQLPLDNISLQGIILRKFPMISFNGEFYVTGKSRKNDEDEFNEEIGVYIAESKAQQKAYNIANRFYTEIYNLISEISNKMKILKNNCELCEIHCKNHIIELGEIDIPKITKK